MKLSPRARFRRSVEDEILRRITAEDPVERNFHMWRQEVDQIGRDSGLSEEDARRLFFLLAASVWVGEIMGAESIQGYRVGAPIPEPLDWLGVEFDVSWFQEEGKAPTPLP